MKNNLITDPSPYLQQHKNNPVHWQIWNKETLIRAKEIKKPILLSIGYASCHWCHVMAHESFEDQETADLMNKHFINIKVDREERPDIDFVFQSSFQLFNQTGGGWPLTMFLDENGVPFIGGTYFPKTSQHGILSFKEVILKVTEIYSNQKQEIINQSSIILKSLELKQSSVLNQDLIALLESIIINLDEEKGGYKGSPKFPIFNVYESLLYFFNKTKKKNYLKNVELILKKLCSEGIYDHVEGGISRYTVDENWLIPHFEKMLYDNAQFILLLSGFLKVNRNAYFEKKLIQTIEFININFLNNDNNLLGSSYDADSDGKEGKYYTFKYDEIKNIKEIDLFYEVKAEGNWEGKIILREIKEPPEHILKELKKIREDRNKPFFDNKTQLDLNSLWVSALISADKILPDKKYLNKAENFFDNIEKVFFIDNDELFHSNSKKIVFIEDYAYTISMLLDLFDRTYKQKYLIKAKLFSNKAIELFYIKEKKIFQKNKISNNDLFHRPIDIGDHTISNGNSIMLMNFARLGMSKEGKELSESINKYLNLYKSSMTSSLKSLDFFDETLSNKNCNEEGCVTD